MVTIKILMFGIDEAIRRAEGFHLTFLHSVRGDLDWLGMSALVQMREGHPPGGPAPPGGKLGPLPEYGTHRFVDRSGDLVKSMGYTVESAEERKANVSIYALAPYAHFVEEGTVHARPYPYFWPSIYKFMPEFEERLQTTIDSLIDETFNA